MKPFITRLILFALILGSFYPQSFSQVPQGFNYMAIARDGESAIIPGADLKVRIGILQTVEPEDLLWEEEHQVTTDLSGLFQLIVGDPLAVQSGGSLASFGEINWLNQPVYLRTSIYWKGTWTVMGDARLFSVPYALVSGNVSGVLPQLNIKGLASDPTEALFEIKNKDGQTIFAVYSEGVRIYVSDGDNKGVKGGFAVGGFDDTKGNQEYLRVTSDSTRIYVNDEPAKGLKGGFAVGGFDLTKGTETGSYLNITKENYLIGQETGIHLEPSEGGLYNSFLGYQAGFNTTYGFKNYFIGYKAGYTNTTGFSNIIIGDSAGYKNNSGYFNTFIGNWSGYNNTTGLKNLFIGHRAGTSNLTGICNVFLGPDAGGSNTTAWYNTFVGIGAGYRTTTGGYNSYYGINSGYAMAGGFNNAFYGSNSGYWFDGGMGNTFLGAEAGRGGPDSDPPDGSGNYNTLVGAFTSTVLESASYNTIVGAYAGGALRTGQKNVFLGYQAGSSVTGDNKLYIANSSANPPLVYGDFATKQLGFNTMTLNKTVNVGGDVEVTGNITSATINGALTGNVTGNLTGNVSGDVTGTVNGIGMGRILQDHEGPVQTIAAESVVLFYSPDEERITLQNKNGDKSCSYWYRLINGETSKSGSGELHPAENIDIIVDEITDNTGFEIHFSQPEETRETCSTWFQYYNGLLSGHYIKF